MKLLIDQLDLISTPRCLGAADMLFLAQVKPDDCCIAPEPIKTLIPDLMSVGGPSSTPKPCEKSPVRLLNYLSVEQLLCPLAVSPLSCVQC